MDNVQHLALLAALLEAGDRASLSDPDFGGTAPEGVLAPPERYVDRAGRILDAAMRYARVAPIHDPRNDS